MNFPEELMYTKSHEWVQQQEDNTYLIGITDYAQEALGDLVFISLPEVDDEVTKEEAFSDVESVKAVSDVISPVSGTIVEINEELADDPALINSDPYGSWMIKVANLTDHEEFMTAEAYKKFVESLD